VIQSVSLCMQPGPVAAIPGLRRKRGSISRSAIRPLEYIYCTVSKGTQRNTKSTWNMLFHRVFEVLAKAFAPPRPQSAGQKPTNFFRFHLSSSPPFPLQVTLAFVMLSSLLVRFRDSVVYHSILQAYLRLRAACCCRQSGVDAKNPG
jgi:hypothetical protein